MTPKKPRIDEISSGPEITDNDVRVAIRYKGAYLEKLQSLKERAIRYMMQTTSNRYIEDNVLRSSPFAGGGDKGGSYDKVASLVIRAMDAEERAEQEGQRQLDRIERVMRKYYVIMLAYENLARQKDRDVLDVADCDAETVYAAAQKMTLDAVRELPKEKVTAGAKNARFQARKKLWANIGALTAGNQKKAE